MTNLDPTAALTAIRLLELVQEFRLHCHRESAEPDFFSFQVWLANEINSNKESEDE